MSNYETINNIAKNKYEDIINNKENEMEELKAAILTYKIERDKYLNNKMDKFNLEKKQT